MDMVDDHSKFCFKRKLKADEEIPVDPNRLVHKETPQEINGKILSLQQVLQIKLKEMDPMDRSFPMLEKIIVMISEAIDRVVKCEECEILTEICADIQQINQMLSGLTHSQAALILGISSKIKPFVLEKINAIDPLHFKNENHHPYVTEQQPYNAANYLIKEVTKFNVEKQKQDIKDKEYKKDLFFELAATLKLKLPPNHRARNILIGQLYEEMVGLNIPEKEWEELIWLKFKCSA